MNLRKLRAAALTIAGFALIAGQLSAAPITGTLNITGGVVVSQTEIDWVPVDGTEGTFTTEFPATGYFTGIYGGNPPHFTGDAVDLTAPQQTQLAFLNDFDA